MYEQMAIDRISEVESLTDNLTDDVASWLIRWGIEAAPALLAGIKDADKAGAKINDILAVMRKINVIIPARESQSLDDLAKDLTDFANVYSKAFGTVRKLTAKELAKYASEIKKKSPLEAIQYMLSFLARRSVPHPATAKSKK